MAVLHIGTATTLAEIATADISNNDVAYIWLNSYTRKMVFDSVSVKAQDTTNHPYYIRPVDFDEITNKGVWIEDVGADQPEAWNGAQIRTGIIASTNWVDGTSGMMIDLDNELIAIKDDTFGNAGVQIGWISSAYKLYVGDGEDQFLKFDGTKFTWKASNSELDGSGNLVVTGGTVGGFTLGEYSIISTLIGLHSAGYGEGAEILLGHATAYASAIVGLKADGSGKLAAGNIAWDALGAITLAGALTSTATITGGTIQTASSGARSVLGSAGLAIYDATTQRAKIGSDGAGWFGASDKFAWTTAGVVTAGGFTLAATTLTATNLLLDAGNQRIQLGTGNDIVTLDAADATYRLAIGHATYASAPFRVTKAGVLTAVGANITGNITGGNLVISSTGAIYSTGKTSYADTDAGFFLGYDTDAYKLNIGDANNYLKYDGSTLTLNVKANFGTGDGVIYKGGSRWLYDFNPAHNGTCQPNGYNLFFGMEAGNLSIGSTATSTGQSSCNIGIGYQSLYSLTKGSYNVGIGYQSLYDITTGNQNSAFGYQALYENTTGYQNCAFGNMALLDNTEGYINIAIGSSALENNIIGNYSIAIGFEALLNANATSNIAIGTEALKGLTSGICNVGIGLNAGRLQSDGSTDLQTPEYSLYIGYQTKSGSDPSGGEDAITNEIVIGYNATGNGSNTITLGNTSITDLYTSGNIILSDAKYISTDQVRARDGDGLKLYDDDGNGIFVKDGGNVGIGTTSPSAKLHVAGGNVKVDSGYGIDFSSTSDATGMTSELLDDYEEGTWTPTYKALTTDFDAITYDAITEGKYIKVGKLVLVQFVIKTDSITMGSAAGNVVIDGLPFSNDGNGTGSIGYANNFADDHPLSAYISTYFRLMYRPSANDRTNTLAPADLDTGADKNYLMGSAVYYTS